MCTDDKSLVVIFRKFIDGGDIIALFPCEPGDNNFNTCSSYQHIGQHGAASIYLTHKENKTTKPAKPEEYCELLLELAKIYEGYTLTVVKRWSYKYDKARRKALELARSNKT